MEQPGRVIGLQPYGQVMPKHGTGKNSKCLVRCKMILFACVRGHKTDIFGTSLFCDKHADRRTLLRP